MSYYAENPWERDENPRCPECDECMHDNGHMGMRKDWECRNPDCENCAKKYKNVSEGELLRQAAILLSDVYKFGADDSVRIIKIYEWIQKYQTATNIELEL